MSLFHDPALLGSSGSGATAYQIARSLRFNSGDNSRLDLQLGSNGNRQTFTLSWWMKRCNIGSSNARIFGVATGTNQFSIMHESNGRFYCYFNLDSLTDTSELTYNVALKDPSAWYHCVMAFDTTQSTDSDRIKFWLNGVFQNDTSEGGGGMATSNWPLQNASFKWNQEYSSSGATYRIGGIPSFYTNTYLTEIYSIDGQALQASDFGEYNDDNIWVPKKYEGTFGTTGFYLDFSDPTSTTTIAQDKSGNGNNFTTNGITVSGTGTDSMVDSPTRGTQSDTGAGGEVSGNYATFNPLVNGNSVSFSDGNLTASADIDNSTTATIAIPEDVKIYFEYTVDQVGGGSAQSPIVGVCDPSLDLDLNPNSQQSIVWSYASGTGQKLGGGGSFVAHGDSLSANDILGVAIDRANGRIWFSKNGTWQNSSDPTDGSDSNAAFTNVPTSETLLLFYSNINTRSGDGTLNCGQRAFSYNAPTGYKTLNTTNLPTPTITDGSTVMDTTLYVGNGSSQSITSLNFQPDLVWIKNRDTLDGQILTDSVRGTTKVIRSNLSDNELTITNGIQSFNSDGFSISDNNQINTNTENYVAWSWEESATAGFDIVTYNGTGSAQTISHNLGVKPYVIIVKRLDTAANWSVYFEPLGATKFMRLNTDIAETVSSAHWNDTEPTSSVFTVNTSSTVNNSSGNYVAYLWAPVEGYSSIGSYTGNGNANGPFVYTGFRPRWVMIKRTNNTANWWLFDTKRLGYNVDNNALYADANATETSLTRIDLVSNGFKLTSSTAGTNNNNSNYVYVAFAENPFKYALAR